jgi:hypothetical protein
MLLFVLSVAALWYEDLRADGVPLTTVLGSMVFLVFVTMGPALLAKQVFEILVPLEEQLRHRRLLVRYLGDAKKRAGKAEHDLRQVVLEREWYRQERERLRAAYLLAYRAAGGKLDNPYR